MAVASRSFSAIQSSTTTPSLAIFTSFSGGTVGWAMWALDLVQLGLRLGVVVGQPVGVAEDLAEVDDADGDAAGLEQLLAVAHGLESIWPGADGAQASVLHAVGDLAHAYELVEVGAEGIGLDRDRVGLGQRVPEAVLAQVAGDGDLAAEGIAPAVQREGGDVVG